MTQTDINTSGWIGKLPSMLQPYALLARLDRPVGIWLLLLPGWWAIALASGGAKPMNTGDWVIFTLFAAGAIVMRGAGCVINDLWDRELDKSVARTAPRPLASGAVPPRAAMIFLALLLLAGLAVLLQMNMVTILLGVLSLPFIIAYPLMKRITWWPQAFLGLTFNFGALMGWSAISGIIQLPALLLYAGGIFWTLGYDTVYAHQDREDDALAGIKSTALKFGKRSKDFIAAFYTLAGILIFSGGIAAGAGYGFTALTLFALWHISRQIAKWNPDDAQESLALFRANRDFGFLILLACAV